MTTAVARGTGAASQQPPAEFDALADSYHAVHKANVAMTGEDPEYFAEYKIADLARLATAISPAARTVLDFGCGIGNSIPFFRRHFPGVQLTCADASERSMEVARSRFPGGESFVTVGKTLPLPSGSQDLVFSACVFHHIPHEEHLHWLCELRRVTRPGGWLAIYEHNPLNPLTQWAVRTCPLDENARLVGARALRRMALLAGWSNPDAEYKVFFPAALRFARAWEGRLGRVPLGAQYRLAARR